MNMMNPADMPTRPDPPDRVPLHQRVQESEDRADAIEDALNALIERHNKLAADVTAELGLLWPRRCCWDGATRTARIQRAPERPRGST